MAKSQETFNKKEKEKIKKKKREDKQHRKEERKANASDGSFESMIAYVDENGNFSSTPPDSSKRKHIIAENIEIGVSRQKPAKDEDPIKKGTVTFYNDSKGYGFIKVEGSQDSIFVHANKLEEPIKENDKVLFEVEKGPKGLNAVNVKIAR
nr:cold shock domain-containing protein [Pseudopedobacter sp.]